MSRPLVIDGRVATIGGRVVTDANGAPCCCDPVPCPCDLSVTGPMERIGCPDGERVPLLGGARFGVVFMRVLWRASHNFTFTNGSGQTFAHRSSGEGAGLLCIRPGNLIQVLPGSFSRSVYTYEADTGSGTWTLEMDHTTSNGWARHAQLSGSTSGPLVVSVFPASVAALRGPWGGPGALVAGPTPLVGLGCTWSEAPPGSGYSRSSEFADSDAGGAGRGTITATGPGATGSGEVYAEWTRDLACRLAAPGPGLLPPGIDPMTLRPIVPGCPGCGA